MSALAPDHPRSRERVQTAPALLDHPGVRERPQASPSPLDRRDGEPTLDELLSGVWEELAAHRPVACPACGAQLTPRYGAHARPIGGRCESCGSSLS